MKNKVADSVSVRIGNRIEFVRNEKTIAGIIHMVREHSVIVEVSEENQEFLGIENELTVVNHKNYRVVN